jgi:hypothetical protein
MKKFLKYNAGIILLVLLGVSIFNAHSVKALSNVGLDPAEFGNSARYALENSVDVSNANNITISLYYMNTNPTASPTSKPPTDMVVQAFDFGSRTNTGVRFNGGSAFSGGTHNLTIPKASFTYRADINAWSSSLSASMSTSSGRVQFRMQITTPTAALGKLGYSASNGSRFGSANRGRCDSGGDTSGCGRFYTYTIPFGTPCSVAQNTTVKAYIFDGDNTTGSQYSVQYNKKFTVRVVDTTTNTTVNSGRTGGSGEGNKQTAEYQFNVVPYHKYNFIVSNVYTNNLLQFQLPYDSIESIANCDAFKVTDRVYGSWVEYRIFAIGSIKGAGSGSAFADKRGLPYATLCDYSKLSFVNATTSNPAKNCSASSSIGGYSTGRTIPNVAANFPVVANQTPVYDDADPNLQGLYTSHDTGNPVVSDPITISAKNIVKNQWIVINAPNTDVTITGDIKYENGSFQSIGQIPQMVIIAKNIHIAANVGQVDAWLIAQGSKAANTGILDTCAISNDYTTKLSVNVCNAPLTVNGPVMAQELWLRRTGGSGFDDASGDPAEVFNLRPDAYLWGYARASTSGRVQTVYTQELPPRF